METVRRDGDVFSWALLLLALPLWAACDADPTIQRETLHRSYGVAHTTGGEVDASGGWDAPGTADVDAGEPDVSADAEGDVAIAEDAPEVGPDADADASADADADADADAYADAVWPDVVVADTISGPTRYPADRIGSPLTAFIRDHLLAVAALDAALADDVFMKVGASGTVNSHFMSCFAGPDEAIDLDGRTWLWPTVEHFRGGDADGSTPFDRETLAAKVGMSAVWAITGDPSPLEQEIAAIAPRLALVAYGTNDMQLGTTYQSASWGFHDNLVELVDGLLAQGIIPVITTITPRADVPAADLWVPTYNAIIRGIAQGRQVPLVDLHLAVQPIPGFGLAGDGLHMNAYSDGGARPCVFTDEALEYGYNVRNLILIEMLHALVDVLLTGAEPPDATIAQPGIGSPDDPVAIGPLPFTDQRDTTASPYALLDEYTGCGADQDESGPELLYRLVVEEPTAIRAMVFDRGDVDIDLHLLDATATAAGCIERDHRIIERTLAPGTYHFALDTYVSGGVPQAGEYTFVVVACDPADAACD